MLFVTDLHYIISTLVDFNSCASFNTVVPPNINEFTYNNSVLVYFHAGVSCTNIVWLNIYEFTYL
jgi:hypothetical protein